MYRTYQFPLLEGDLRYAFERNAEDTEYTERSSTRLTILKDGVPRTVWCQHYAKDGPLFYTQAILSDFIFCCYPEHLPEELQRKVLVPEFTGEVYGWITRANNRRPVPRNFVVSNCHFRLKRHRVAIKLSGFHLL